MRQDGFGIHQIEQAVVSAMMQWPDEVEHISSSLKKEHFGHHPNRVLYDQVVSEFNTGQKFDLILFTQRLRDRGMLNTVGGPGYVTETWLNTCHSQGLIDFYIDRILEENERKSLVKVCTRSIAAAHSGDEDAVTEAIEKISHIPLKRLKKERTLAEAADEKTDRLENGKPDTDVIPTGLEQLDLKSPLRKGDMPLIIGNRKSGKSILALSIATNVARNGTPVAYFSLEDREPKVFDRIFSGMSRVPLSVNHVGRMTEEQTNKASRAILDAGSLPISIIDDPCTLREIQGRSRSLVARGTGLLVVDYAQLVRCPGQESRREEVEKVSRDLRLLCLELNVPLILVCQLNKEGGTRESATMEMDATAAWQIDAPNEGEQPNKRFIRIPWQRNEESGISFPVTFLGSIARIENYVDPEHQKAIDKKQWW